MSFPLALLPNAPLSGGARRVARRACVAHFMFGDSIQTCFGASSSFPTGTGAPAGGYIFGQNSIEYPGVRFDNTAAAGLGMLPYGSGHGWVGAQGGSARSHDIGGHIIGGLIARTTPKGGGAGSGPDHVFAQVGVTSGLISPTGVASVSFAPGNTMGDAFIDGHVVPMMTLLRDLYPGGVYLGALTAISFGAEARTVGGGGGEDGSALAFTANFTTIVNDFRSNINVASGDIPVFLMRSPTIDSGVEASTFPDHSVLRTAQDSSGGTNNIVTLDIDEAPYDSAGVHRTPYGSSVIARILSEEYAKIGSFPLWGGF